MNNKPLSNALFLCLFLLTPFLLKAQAQDPETARKLHELQQKFVDLRFGMFIHYNIPTYSTADWPDPETPASVFNPKHLDANQWAKAAKSANMSYGCLTTKHHSGFCIWDTKTTDYNVMNSPYGKDVVKQFTDAFRANGLKVMLYYSILDTHHKLRPNQIVPKHIEMVKAQITELLTKYGKIEALIIDGWDAPWSRISYDDIPFEDIYRLIKRLQPDCLVMDLNGAKYPAEGLYYTDIKTYEMGAGQRLSKDSKAMPSLACLPINKNWFWKTEFPTAPVRKASEIVDKLIKPLNAASCNFILNVAPNRDGRIDDNAIQALKEVGQLWNNPGPAEALPMLDLPIISSNLAKHAPANSSWSDDMNIMDFANDDDYKTSWVSNALVDKPWYEVDLVKEQGINTIVIAEEKPNIDSYILEYWNGSNWTKIFEGKNVDRIKVHRVERFWASKVRMRIQHAAGTAALTEFQLFNERR
jgi:alpha-L-fucosidase